MDSRCQDSHGDDWVQFWHRPVVEWIDGMKWPFFHVNNPEIWHICNNNHHRIHIFPSHIWYGIHVTHILLMVHTGICFQVNFRQKLILTWLLKQRSWARASHWTWTSFDLLLIFFWTLCFLRFGFFSTGSDSGLWYENQVLESWMQLVKMILWGQTRWYSKGSKNADPRRTWLRIKDRKKWLKILWSRLSTQNISFALPREWRFSFESLLPRTEELMYQRRMRCTNEEWDVPSSI